jgi:glycosyltransferase involved in cell wall biosynthesis
MMSLVPLDLTIVIPVLNEEKNIALCLDAIGKDFARRVVVIDSGSTDRTRKIAIDHGAEVIDFEWNGQFPKKRNWFLRNHTPSTSWVLFLDADEHLTDSFKKEASLVLSHSKKSGYWLNYTIHFLGSRLKGGYPLRKLALFRIGSGEYEEIAEERWSNLDMEIHEHPVLSGEIGMIKAPIDHRDDRGIDHYLAKHKDYASWEASRIRAAKANPSAFKRWTWKQKLKFHLSQSWMAGPVYFLGSYVLMGGFRDGSRGFVFALLKAAYFTQVYCKIRESLPVMRDESKR